MTSAGAPPTQGCPRSSAGPGTRISGAALSEPQGRREEDVDMAHSTTDVQAALAVLEKYQVEFVYVGPLERQSYESPGLEKFRQFRDVAYENADVTIYRRKGSAAPLV